MEKAGLDADWNAGRRWWEAWQPRRQLEELGLSRLESFASYGVVHLATPCHFIPEACCPDKDLVLLVTRVGGRDRMGLWTLSGTKTWEIDPSPSSERIISCAWSPDGQSIAIAQHPPSVSLHSLQDGHEERSISLPFNEGTTITGVWWFRHEKIVEAHPVPDIFRRNDVITGSSHSILRNLPLLDSLQENSQQVTATNIFAFQGSQTQSPRKSSIPDVIKSWPMLQNDPLAASIDAVNRTIDPALDDPDDTNIDSILAVADDSGCVAFYLDGTYHIGTLELGSGVAVSDIFKHPQQPRFMVHLQRDIDGSKTQCIEPSWIFLPLLETRKVRDFAKLSTTARELVWYIMRVVEEMRAVWMGSETNTGACELGPKWLRSFENSQRKQFGQASPTPILDLTKLLVTGRASEALSDFLGSGEQMGERGLRKWESTVTEALVKIRDYSEKRLAPACQRLYLVLAEVKGWSLMPNEYSLFEIPSYLVEQCMEAVARAIMLAAWLAASARRENNRFKEFMAWLSFETTSANTGNETAPPLRHDILEVNEYLMKGLEGGTIDRWFTGKMPEFSPQDLGVPNHSLSLAKTLQEVQKALEEDSEVGLNTEKDMPDPERNISALADELATNCRQVFDRSTGAATRSARIRHGYGSVDRKGQGTGTRNISVRERTIMQVGKNFEIRFAQRKTRSTQDGDYLQHLVIHRAKTSEDRAFLCVVRQRFGDNETEGSVALLECSMKDDEGEEVEVDIVGAEFFDDESIVIIFRKRDDQDDGTFIGTIQYVDLGYKEVQREGHVTPAVREDLIESALQRLKAGEIDAGKMELGGHRRLGIRGDSLAVNGRAGRRVGCIVDERGTGFESIDLEGSEE
ncbi:hypothetical protein K435DRAFT_835171 [Dendrothele bispora CBS 962.96]|uniref:Anaphase-promoting complex subunit 4 n=1 Tax=Dendrothele bispora (strain CBS 962.96) TaxID=1314807 RepID=A0A4S8MPX5_DENBC|nr:hypothetical protein K435DRAFT_835171 [Dendrothele bispora CBS 962.96]